MCLCDCFVVGTPNRLRCVLIMIMSFVWWTTHRSRVWPIGRTHWFSCKQTHIYTHTLTHVLDTIRESFDNMRGRSRNLSLSVYTGPLQIRRTVTFEADGRTALEAKDAVLHAQINEHLTMHTLLHTHTHGALTRTHQTYTSTHDAPTQTRTNCGPRRCAYQVNPRHLRSMPRRMLRQCPLLVRMQCSLFSDVKRRTTNTYK